jgi:NitT/TauT family transport system permease protein/taurine transport system permease protein
VLALWWTIYEVFQPAPTKLVSPGAVWDALWQMISRGILSDFIARSLQRLALGTVMALVVGVPIGWLLGLNRTVAHMFEPILRFFNGVSGIAWLPLMILNFGFTDKTIQTIIVYTMIFPVVFNSMVGVRTVPARFASAARTLGAGRLRIVRDVYVPGTFPSVMTGLRLAIGFGWRALIAGEFVVGGGGLGDLIFTARTNGVIARVMAGMIVIGVLWLILDRLILAPIEEYTATRWGLLRT